MYQSGGTANKRMVDLQTDPSWCTHGQSQNGGPITLSIVKNFTHWKSIKNCLKCLKTKTSYQQDVNINSPEDKQWNTTSTSESFSPWCVIVLTRAWILSPVVQRACGLLPCQTVNCIQTVVPDEKHQYEWPNPSLHCISMPKPIDDLRYCQ